MQLPRVAEPIVELYASRILSHPPLLSEFVDYVFSWITMAEKFKPEELIKVRKQVHDRVVNSLRNLSIGWVYTEDDEMVHDMVKTFFGVD